MRGRPTFFCHCRAVPINGWGFAEALLRFLHPERDQHLELSLNDVFIVPGSFEGRSRLEVDLRPVDFPGGSHPVSRRT